MFERNPRTWVRQHSETLAEIVDYAWFHFGYVGIVCSVAYTQGYVNGKPGSIDDPAAVSDPLFHTSAILFSIGVIMLFTWAGWKVSSWWSERSEGGETDG